MHASGQSPIEDTPSLRLSGAWGKGFSGPVLSSFVGVREAKSHDVAQQAGPSVQLLHPGVSVLHLRRLGIHPFLLLVLP